MIVGHKEFENYSQKRDAVSTIDKVTRHRLKEVLKDSKYFRFTLAFDKDVTAQKAAEDLCQFLEEMKRHRKGEPSSLKEIFTTKGR